VSDLAGATLLLLATFPLLVASAVSVWASMGRPVFFRQERPGLDGRGFQMVKFRTMTEATDTEGRLLHDEARLSGVGRFLRSTSLDELPSLWNVLKGDMSLVGPRPLRVEYLPFYTAEERRRHEVRPGITGWAQVNGRNAVSWDERLAMDVWYVDNRSFALDLRILWMTLWKVLKREGVTAAGGGKMPRLDEERAER
jgi:lipopolysaccharide/colanic/teichoic acid biosynthesis glycosyltransferase